VFPVSEGSAGLVPCLNRIRKEAEDAANSGYRLILLSDRKISKDVLPVP
jgi:hypothetical protein